MKKLLVIAALVALVASPAVAGLATSMKATSHTPTGPVRASFFDFEAETVGTPFTPSLSGWTSDWDPNTEIIGVGAISGSQSARHNSDGSAVAGNELNSPLFTATPDFYSDIRRDGAEGTGTTGSLYHWIPNNSAGYFNTRVQLNADGSIDAAQVNTAMTAFVFVPTTGSWTPGIATQIGISIDLGTGALDVLQDGGVIFSGVETNWLFTGTAAGADTYFTFSDNADVDYLVLDDFTDIAVPEPTTLALLGLGALALIRRR